MFFVSPAVKTGVPAARASGVAVEMQQPASIRSELRIRCVCKNLIDHH